MDGDAMIGARRRVVAERGGSCGGLPAATTGSKLGNGGPGWTSESYSPVWADRGGGSRREKKALVRRWRSEWLS